MDKIEQFIDLFVEVWRDGISGINISEIVIAILIFFAFLLLRGFFAKFIIKRLEKYVSKTTNRFDNSLVQSLKGPTKFFPIVIGFFIATSYVSLGDSTENFIDNANRTLITILIFWSIHQIIGPLSVLIKSIEDLLSKDLLNWIIKAIKILILILGAAAVLELWGIKIGPIIAGLGLFGVAVALGAQDLFKNLISGILVLVEKRFKVGDWILVENIIEGIVEGIGFRSTVVRKFDKSVAIIPNFQFAENAVINISETTNWRISWIITLQYDTTVDQLKKIRDEIDNYIISSKDYKKSDTTMHAVRIDKFSDSSIDMYVRCFTNTDKWSEWLKVKERLAIAIKEIVEKNKASFAFPSQSIYVEKK
jgi:MscS family membrane protein